MIALLVKPSAWKKTKYRRMLDELVMQGAYIFSGHTQHDIAQEIAQLLTANEQVTVVACGGDGTVHLLVNAVGEYPVTFAVLPMGTGNDFARYLGIRDIQTGKQVLDQPHETTFDVGHIALDDGTRRRFIGVTSCGFDAQVNERANTYRGPAGTAKYIAALLGEIKSLRSLTLDIEIDGELDQREVVLLAIGNTSSYGGGMKVCPDANAQDGQFSVISVAPVTRTLLLRVFPRVFFGSHIKHPKVTSLNARSIRVGGEAFPMYADGERIGMGPATITISPQALVVKALSSQ